jgi:uncharacterized membrane protein
MKVYIRSYRIPTVLLIMGSIMCIMATSIAADKYEMALFAYGTICLFFGLMGWLGVQLAKIPAALFKPKQVQAPPAKRR